MNENCNISFSGRTCNSIFYSVLQKNQGSSPWWARTVPFNTVHSPRLTATVPLTSTLFRYSTVHYRAITADGLQTPTVNGKWSLYFIDITVVFTAVFCTITFGPCPKKYYREDPIKIRRVSYPIKIIANRTSKFHFQGISRSFLLVLIFEIMYRSVVRLSAKYILQDKYDKTGRFFFKPSYNRIRKDQQVFTPAYISA